MLSASLPRFRLCSHISFARHLLTVRASTPLCRGLFPCSALKHGLFVSMGPATGSGTYTRPKYLTACIEGFVFCIEPRQHLPRLTILNAASEQQSWPVLDARPCDRPGLSHARSGTRARPGQGSSLVQPRGDPSKCPSITRRRTSTEASCQRHTPRSPQTLTQLTRGMPVSFLDCGAHTELPNASSRQLTVKATGVVVA